MSKIKPFDEGPLKVSLVGAGFVTPIHLRGWQMLDNVTVVALASRTQSKANEVAANFKVPNVYTSFEEMIETENPDVVDICSPAETHLDYIRQAAAHGIDVICQKPIATDMADAEEIAAIASDHNIRIMVHENFRFRVWYREVKRLLESGIIGKPFYCRSDARIPGTVLTSDFPQTPWSIRRQPFFADLDRFLILESAIHQIDVCRFLFGDVQRIYARSRSVSPEVTGEDLTSMMLDFDGLHAVVERSYASRGYPNPPLITETMTIEGDRGTLFLEQDGHIRVEVDVPGERQTIIPDYDIEEAYPNSYAAAIRHFVERLRDGSPFETDINDNLKTLAATLAAYDSCASGDAIVLQDNEPSK